MFSESVRPAGMLVSVPDRGKDDETVGGGGSRCDL